MAEETRRVKRDRAERFNWHLTRNFLDENSYRMMKHVAKWSREEYHVVEHDPLKKWFTKCIDFLEEEDDPKTFVQIVRKHDVNTRVAMNDDAADMGPSVLIEEAFSFCKKPALLAVLKKRGANINYRFKGRTLLHTAANGGNGVAFAVGIKWGLDPHARDNHGDEPIIYGLRSAGCDAKTCRLLFRLTGTDPMGFYPCTRTLYDEWLPFAHGQFPSTAKLSYLHMVAQNEPLTATAGEIVEHKIDMGLEYGFEVDVSHGGGPTPMLMACVPAALCDKPDILEYLREKGANLSLPQNKEVFHYIAYIYNRPSDTCCLEWCIENGLDINDYNDNLVPPLFRACATAPRLHFMLENGADPSALSKHEKPMNLLRFMADHFAAPGQADENSLDAVRFALDLGFRIYNRETRKRVCARFDKIQQFVDMCCSENYETAFEPTRCSYEKCGKFQTAPVTFKRCGACVEDVAWRKKKRVYCGKACQRADWAERHKREHESSNMESVD